MNVLAISCHPDDMEISCAGTLLACKKRGDNVTVCHVANGNMGHVVLSPEELREIRINEAKESGKLAFAASFSASVAHYKPELGEATPVTPIFYMENAGCIDCEPEYYVDITEEIETKLDTLACHQSQLVWLRDHDNIDALEESRAKARLRGSQCGVKYAEGFRCLKADLRNPVKRFLP